MTGNRRYSVHEAGKMILDTIREVPEQEIPIRDSLGYVLSRNVYTRIAQPPFPRSAMDGYALKAKETRGAGQETPVYFKVAGCQFAGDPYFRKLLPGEALRIMTGAAIPEGADAVIRQEDTDCGEDRVAVYAQVENLQNYCEIGEDFPEGLCLAEEGDLVDAFLISAAAAGGISSFMVRRKPKVALLTTGDEIQTPGTRLEEGKIYNSQEALFTARLRQLGCEVSFISSPGDSVEKIMEAMNEASRCSDLIITTGGVSVGLKDCIPEVMERLEAEIIFHGISVKPGMPTMFSLYRDIPVLSLSGNPYSASAIFELLVQPIVRKMTGNRRQVLKKVTGISGDTFEKKQKITRFLRGYYEDGKISFGKGQRNGQTRAGIGCNCLICLEPGQGPVKIGDELTAYLIY